jgi:hypothetical protein
VDRKIFNTIEIYSSINGPLLRKIHVPDRRFEDVLIDPNDVTCCEVCGECTNEEVLLLCDGCDKGFHIYCLSPPLKRVPRGNWYCVPCKQIVLESKRALLDESNSDCGSLDLDTDTSSLDESQLHQDAKINTSITKSVSSDTEDNSVLSGKMRLYLPRRIKSSSSSISPASSDNNSQPHIVVDTEDDDEIDVVYVEDIDESVKNHDCGENIIEDAPGGGIAVSSNQDDTSAGSNREITNFISEYVGSDHEVDIIQIRSRTPSPTNFDTKNFDIKNSSTHIKLNLGCLVNRKLSNTALQVSLSQPGTDHSLPTDTHSTIIGKGKRSKRVKPPRKAKRMKFPCLSPTSSAETQSVNKTVVARTVADSNRRRRVYRDAVIVSHRHERTAEGLKEASKLVRSAAVVTPRKNWEINNSPFSSFKHNVSLPKNDVLANEKNRRLQCKKNLSYVVGECDLSKSKKDRFNHKKTAQLISSPYKRKPILSNVTTSSIAPDFIDEIQKNIKSLNNDVSSSASPHQPSGSSSSMLDFSAPNNSHDTIDSSSAFPSLKLQLPKMRIPKKNVVVLSSSDEDASGDFVPKKLLVHAKSKRCHISSHSIKVKKHSIRKEPLHSKPTNSSYINDDGDSTAHKTMKKEHVRSTLKSHYLREPDMVSNTKHVSGIESASASAIADVISPHSYLYVNSNDAVEVVVKLLEKHYVLGNIYPGELDKIKRKAIAKVKKATSAVPYERIRKLVDDYVAIYNEQ